MVDPNIKKLAYEKITDRYYKAKYLGLECIMDNTNGYINASKICLTYVDRSKKITKYIARARYKILITYYMTNITEYSPNLSIKVDDGPKKFRGIYLHPILFLDLAIWISPDAYMKAVKIISTELVKEIDSEKSLARLETTLETALKSRENALEKIIIQNERLHIKIDRDIKLSLKHIETKVDKLYELDKPKEKFSFHRCYARIKKKFSC